MVGKVLRRMLVQEAMSADPRLTSTTR